MLSQVGFRNVWRFPSSIYEYGGAAYFIPYALAVIFVGLPILVLEVALGQYYKTGGERSEYVDDVASIPLVSDIHNTT
jgi:SNF family Na+-dependent transporter